MTFYLYTMNDVMSIEKGEKLWEEKNLIGIKKNYLNNNELEQKDIINDINSRLTKSQCKDIGKISGIYKIINKINGKYYVGSSNDVIGNSGRWYAHKRLLKLQSHINKYLQNAWNKYGENNFDFVIVEVVPENDLLMIEQKYLDIAKTEKDKCYNICYDAQSPMKGKKHTLEARRKMSIRLKGRTFSEKHKENLSKINKGKTRSSETKEKLRQKRLGIKSSNETKRKLSKKFSGKSNPRCDLRVYSFKNLITNETFTGTRFDFYKKFNINGCYVGWLVSGRIKKTNGWTLFSKTF